jgi:hypothetical protein
MVISACLSSAIRPRYVRSYVLAGAFCVRCHPEQQAGNFPTSIPCLGCYRQPDGEGGSVARHALDRNFAAVVQDDVIANRQA